jgi:hypothetical protein
MHLDNGHYVLSPSAPSCLIHFASSPNNILDTNMRKLKWDFLADAGHVVLPREDFEIISWESRLPPYTWLVHLVQYVSCCVDDKPETSLSGKKRPGLSAQ